MNRDFVIYKVGNRSQNSVLLEGNQQLSFARLRDMDLYMYCVFFEILVVHPLVRNRIYLVNAETYNASTWFMELAAPIQQLHKMKMKQNNACSEPGDRHWTMPKAGAGAQNIILVHIVKFSSTHNS